MNADNRAPITTHILDTERGKPAAGVAVALWQQVAGQWQEINTGLTDDDGRVEQWQKPLSINSGLYQLVFATGDYFARLNVASFYPQVSISFYVADAQEHFHVPLLLAAHGYSTYRGS